MVLPADSNAWFRPKCSLQGLWSAKLCNFGQTKNPLQIKKTLEKPIISSIKGTPKMKVESIFQHCFSYVSTVMV